MPNKLKFIGQKKLSCEKFQLAIPQLLPGGQFPFSYTTGQPIPGYYIPQPIAQVKMENNNFGNEDNFDEGSKL